jgi:hypothetical protein
MAKTDASFSPEQYATVAERIELFYSRFPQGRINTELVTRENREITFKAFVYRVAEDSFPAATGWASEREGDGDINTVACLENTETSAVGRALANLGFTASTKRPSREEMEKAERVRRSVVYQSPPPVTPREESAAPAAASVAVAAIHHDLLVLMERAEVLGFSTRRLAVIRERLARGPLLSIDESIRIEKALRGWVLRHVRTRVHG